MKFSAFIPIISQVRLQMEGWGFIAKLGGISEHWKLPPSEDTLVKRESVGLIME